MKIPKVNSLWFASAYLAISLTAFSKTPLMTGQVYKEIKPVGYRPNITRLIQLRYEELNTPKGELIQIRYSWYNPNLLGVNCFLVVNNYCVSRLANGEQWELNFNISIACPPEWPFGTIIILDNQEWICKDRGGKIKYTDGIPFVDFLVTYPAYQFGTVLEVEIIYP